MKHLDTGTEHLIAKIENNVGYLIMNRPEARNAMSSEMNGAPFISDDIAFLASGRFIIKYPTLFSIFAIRCSVPVSKCFIYSSLVFYLLFYKYYEIKTVSYRC